MNRKPITASLNPANPEAAFYGSPCRPNHTQPLALVAVKCCICDVDDADPIAVGEDFECRNWGVTQQIQLSSDKRVSV